MYACRYTAIHASAAACLSACPGYCARRALADDGFYEALAIMGALI